MARLDALKKGAPESPAACPAAGACLPLPPCCAGYVLKCMLSPDVRQLATTSSDKTVKLWNLDGFTLDRTLAGGCLPSLPGVTRPKWHGLLAEPGATRSQAVTAPSAWSSPLLHCSARGGHRHCGAVAAPGPP